MTREREREAGNSTAIVYSLVNLPMDSVGRNKNEIKKTAGCVRQTVRQIGWFDRQKNVKTKMKKGGNGCPEHLFSSSC